MTWKECYISAKSDYARHNIPGNGVLTYVKKMSIPGCRYMVIWRFATKLGVLGKLIIRHYSIKYGYQIPIETKIGNGFYIGHVGTLVINHSPIIGNNVNVAQNVTIGAENRGKRKGAPIIGDRVWIGCGSVLVGKIVVGEDVLIAPNTFVNCDVPSHSIVIGNPCVIHSRANATEDYIH